jgi:hypothetical protein
MAGLTMCDCLGNFPAPRPGWLVLLALICLCWFFGTTAHAQSFSADLTIVPRDGAAAAPAGKLYVSGSKVRLETPDLADGFFLIDIDAPSAYFVRPAARTFMEARQSSRLTQWFVPLDPENPCRRWQAMAKLAGTADQGDWRCERAAEALVDSHRTVVWRAIMPSGHEMSGWIDEARQFPLRIKADDGAIVTVGNIRDAPQSVALFEIAAGTRKFDPRQLIEQIKQSDVWVAGQKDAASPR